MKTTELEFRYPLTVKSRSSWYKKCNFLTLKRNSELPQLPSFQWALLQASLHFYIGNLHQKESQKHLLIVQILLQQRTHIFLNLPGKYTLIKPKVSTFFPNYFKPQPNQRLLVLNQQSTIGFLCTAYIRYLLTTFSSITLKYHSKVYFNNKSLFSSISFLKLKGLIKISYLKFRLFSIFLSKFQQKINFLQFNSFLKKLV